VTCSREENRDLFEFSMGGYGLAGIIVDMVADMVPNRMLEPRYEMLGAEAFGEAFLQAAQGDADLQMAYGRVDVSGEGFFRQALMVTYRPDGAEGPFPAASGSGFVSHASREIYRAQPGSERMKKLRWWMETRVGPTVAGRATRNTLMNEPVATLAGRDALRTDILHEYFVPADRFADFAFACREVIPASYQELLNVTLRYVGRDSESVLSYAPSGPRIAAVMSFTQEKSQRAENDMAAMTRALIERVLDIGGSYYLPYRLHATREQALRAYPRLAEFARRKREADPEGRFSNALWERYMKDLDA
jgi:FAD/FMN-containing dehydrogenase